MNDLLTVCEAAARAGGRELLAWQGRFESREKGPADLVTDADLASQTAVRSAIESAFPDHAFLGEETPDVSLLEGDQFVWICDPLDGTTNYVHGYPCFAVSVGIARRGDLLAGVIFDPIANECFSAEKGRGAWLNGTPIRASGVEKVAQALVAVSLPAHVRKDAPDLIDFVRVVEVSQAVRRSGSAALNLAYVANGRLDAFWATHIHAWDVAAGILLVREAGGLVTGRDGRPFDLRSPHFIAASCPPLHRELSAVLTPFAGASSA
jgi:myo-inositol-1(or 4)-monophosphatase